MLRNHPGLGSSPEDEQQQRRKEMVRTVKYVIETGRTAATSSFKLAFSAFTFLDSFFGRYN
jgi:hypothetical protein